LAWRQHNPSRLGEDGRPSSGADGPSRQGLGTVTDILNKERFISLPTQAAVNVSGADNNA
jgi:hypothetical protein